MNDRSRLPKLRILLVDDSDFVFNYVTALLAEAGLPHTAQWCSTYEEGLSELKMQDRFDICLVDYKLGDRDGLEFLNESIAGGCRVPIVMMTGRGDLNLDLECMKAGAADYLVKGEFSPQLLERVIRYAVERRRILERLRDSEERYVLALQGANDGIWDWSVGDDTCYFSARWKAILGYKNDELPNSLDAWFQQVHRSDLPRLQDALAAHINGETDHFENEHRLRHRNDEWRHVLLRGQAVRDQHGKAKRIAGSLTDVTSARAHDPLTGLPNRVLYLDRLEMAFTRSRRDNAYSYALLFVDVDRFKNINDSLGHGAGDELLCSIARRIENCVRTIDTVARLGGDEFTILLDDTREPDGAVRVAERIVDELAKPFKVGGREVYTGASVGVVHSSAHYARPDEMLRDADTAMNQAKSSGKGRYVVFDRAMHDRAINVLSVESGLRRAIEDEQIEPYFQPVIDLKTRRLLGFEALVRWNHPGRGLVPPIEFVPIAEDSNLIIELDRCVIRRSCRQMSLWREAFPELDLFISVNASRKHFVRPGFSDDLSSILAETKMPSTSLHLEVTETVTMDPSPSVGLELQRLADAGVKVYVDDFGIGYSSLSLVQKFPFRGLKIDRSFVSRLETSKQALEVTRAILGMSMALNLTVVAEGVETAEQSRTLTSLGCEQAQGYYFSKPVAADKATALLEHVKKSDGLIEATLIAS